MKKLEVSVTIISLARLFGALPVSFLILWQCLLIIKRVFSAIKVFAKLRISGLCEAVCVISETSIQSHWKRI